ncbi:hypothetical protein [Afifella pfennigii]|uniref:hypothetical protein n=1 Tax=Afifella pfennigii TaxID=209897 RepID=UPI00047DBF0D|nr:hypothetical protein [Afifella pfennigii]
MKPNALDRAFFNPLDPRDRAERNRERAAAFRRLHLMAAVALAMAVFTLMALFRPDLALFYLVAAMLLPPLLLLPPMLLRLRRGAAAPAAPLPGPVRLTLLAGLVFLAFAFGSAWLGVPATLAVVVFLLWPQWRGDL